MNRFKLDVLVSLLTLPCFPTNIEDHGNSSSSCCPILLDECKKKGLLKKGEIIAMSAFGAGFVSGAVLFEW